MLNKVSLNRKKKNSIKDNVLIGGCEQRLSGIQSCMSPRWQWFSIYYPAFGLFLFFFYLLLLIYYLF